MYLTTTALLSLALGSVASQHLPTPVAELNESRCPSPDWKLKKFKSMVVFGDSYTDDSRLLYVLENSGKTPPVGWVNPVNYAASSGGRIWAEYVHQYSGANLYNYAVAGAVCSNNITPRYFVTGTFLYPAVEQYEVPAYIADSKHVEPNGKKFLDVPVDETVYAIWIGTNDLGGDALLSDSQVKGTNISTYLDCVYDRLHQLYENGARNFVLINAVPLNLAPLYALPDAGGVIGASNYWPVKTNTNQTEVSYRMLEEVATVNSIYEYRTPYEVKIGNRFRGSSWALFDVHGLMTDIYYNPSEYLNGSAPLNVTGTVNKCNPQGVDCVPGASPDSFMWFDNLHPSEQTARVIARNFVEVTRGQSKWATYWSSE